MLVHVAFASQLAEPELHSSMSLQVVPVRPFDVQNRWRAAVVLPRVALINFDLGKSGGGEVVLERGGGGGGPRRGCGVFYLNAVTVTAWRQIQVRDAEQEYHRNKVLGGAPFPA